MKTLLFPAIAVALVLYVAIAWIVVKKYRQSRNFGFLILGCGVLLLPMLNSLLLLAFGRMVFATISPEIARGEVMALWTYSYQIIREGLILIGLLLIGRSLNGVQSPVARIS